jgi:hypothetical protein
MTRVPEAPLNSPCTNTEGKPQAVYTLPNFQLFPSVSFYLHCIQYVTLQYSFSASVMILRVRSARGIKCTPKQG